MDLSRSRAVLVGTWAHADPALPDLPAAKHSLRRMETLLTGPLCGWPAGRVTVLAGVDRPGDLPDRLVELYDDVPDVALFYFVGHGKLDDAERLCLALGGTLVRPGRLATTSLRYEDVRHALHASPAQIKIVILDCCYAGMAVAAGGRLGLADDLIDHALVAGTYVMAASAAYAAAWCELPAPERPAPMTYFTKHLVAAAEDGIPGGPARLGLNAIFAAVHERLQRHGQPTPTKRSTDFADGFLFVRNASALEGDGLPERCPICGDPLTVEPSRDERTGLWTSPPPMRLEVHNAEEYNPAWRLRPIGDRMPGAVSTAVLFEPEAVQQVYRLCGSGHILSAPPAGCVVTWGVVASVGAIASGKTYVVRRMLGQVLDDPDAWPDEAHTILHRLPLAPLEAQSASWALARYDDDVQNGLALSPTSTMGVRPGGLLANEMPDVFDAAAGIIRRWVANGADHADQWGRVVHQPHVIRTGSRSRQRWTGIVDMPGEVLSESDGGWAANDLRGYDAVLWAIDPTLSQSARARLLPPNADPDTLLEGWLRPGTIPTVYSATHVAEIRARMQRSISRRVAELRNVERGTREPTLLVVITKCDVIRAALVRGLTLTDLGHPEEAVLGTAQFLSVLASRLRQGSFLAEPEATAFVDLVVGADRADTLAAANELLAHYSDPTAFWNLTELGGPDRLTFAGLAIPPLGRHVRAAAADPGPPYQLRTRDVVMSAVACGLVYALDQPAYLRSILRDVERQLPRFFLTSALGAVPESRDRETLTPVIHDERFSILDTRSAGIAQLLLATLECSARTGYS